MRFDFGLVLGIALECLFFIYYANSLFELKRNRYVCYTAIIMGYMINLISCMFFGGIINLIIFVITNFLLLQIFYDLEVRTAIFQSMLLAVFMLVGELIVIFVEFVDFNLLKTETISDMQSIEITAIGKLIYLIGIIILIHMMDKKSDNIGKIPVVLILIPALTIVCLVIMVASGMSTIMLSYATIPLLAINVIVIMINQNIIKREAENMRLKDELIKEHINTAEYMVLKEKNEQMRIFHHDFKEQMGTLTELISYNTDEAIKYIKNICNVESVVSASEYTDNKILNIILNKKKEECVNKNINFYINPIMSKLNFLKEIDTVSIFSNLINNAIESCEKSTQKNIYLDIYTVNGIYVAIKLTNNSDCKPIVFNQKLKTNKRNKDMHGIGMNSILKAIKNYEGDMNWKYNNEKNTFTITIIIKNCTI